jgi:hypothetical protein
MERKSGKKYYCLIDKDHVLIAEIKSIQFIVITKCFHYINTSQIIIRLHALDKENV